MVPLVPLLLLLLLVPPTVGEVGWGGEVRWRCSKSVSRETEREFWGKSEEREGESRQQTKKRSRQSVERRTSLTSNVKNVEIKTTQRNCLFMIRSRSDRLFESLWPVFDQHQFKIKFQREKFFLEKNLTSSRSVFLSFELFEDYFETKQKNWLKFRSEKCRWTLGPEFPGGK